MLPSLTGDDLIEYCREVNMPVAEATLCREPISQIDHLLITAESQFLEGSGELLNQVFDIYVLINTLPCPDKDRAEFDLRKHPESYYIERLEESDRLERSRVAMIVASTPDPLRDIKEAIQEAERFVRKANDLLDYTLEENPAYSSDPSRATRADVKRAAIDTSKALAAINRKTR